MFSFIKKNFNRNINRLTAMFCGFLSVAFAFYFLPKPLFQVGEQFFSIKVLSLFMALFLSTYNYSISLIIFPRIKFEANVLDPLILNFLFLIFNIICFICAIVYVTEPVQLLSWVMGIYIFFSLNNYFIVKKYLMYNSINTAEKNNSYNHYDKKKIILLIRELKESLTQENGPAVVGYAFITFILLFFIEESSTERIKAFSAGAAGFHLVLSTSKYALEMEGKGLSSKLLESADWNDKMQEHLSRMQVENSWAIFMIFAIISFILILVCV